MFRAILLTESGNATQADLAELDDASLPAGEIEIRTEYSTLNYKDALAITGRAPIVKSWPMVPGVDLSGTITHSTDANWKCGDQVVVTGWGLGETTWGGLAQKCRLSAASLLKLPETFSARGAMAVGTAGVTAALCVMALLRHGLKPSDGDVLVTGAAGGVGSLSIALAAGLGFNVLASTGRTGEAAYLSELGADRIIDRRELAGPARPLQKERWSGVIDTVGGHTLANACASTKWNGAVAACGLAGDSAFPATVMPFILRGVTLYGINSVFVDDLKRKDAWKLLADHVDRKALANLTTEIALDDVISFAPEILAGRARGRTVVNVNR